jgi:hypothetical protein
VKNTNDLDPIAIQVVEKNVILYDETAEISVEISSIISGARKNRYPLTGRANIIYYPICDEFSRFVGEKVPDPVQILPGLRSKN